MRVALFTDTFPPQVNGVAMTLSRLTGYWDRKRIPYLVFAPDDMEPADDSGRVRRVRSFPFPLYPECRIPLSRYAKIEKQLLKFQPDLIHLATPFTLGLLGHRFAHRRGIPPVSSYHTHFDQYLDYYRIPFLKKILWSYMIWFHNHCERTYCPSADTKRVLEQNGIRNAEIWSRGIDPAQYNPKFRNPQIRRIYGIGESKLLLLYVGRIAPEKDIDILLGSYLTLPRDVAERVHLIVVGDGPFMSKINPHDNSSITWTGFLRGRKLSEMYASCDLFVFPSSTETFGNVVLEAMASGLPVIGVESGGVTDIISHMKNGLLCRARSVESFREGIGLLVRNEQLRRQMAYFARLSARKRDWNVIFDRLMDSYQAVLQERRYAKISVY